MLLAAGVHRGPLLVARTLTLRGEPGAVVDGGGKEIARGLANYNSSETAKILRTPSAQIERKLGYVMEDELIHRDNMALHW
mgnify:CR=1 FL=1